MAPFSTCSLSFPAVARIAGREQAGRRGETRAILEAAANEIPVRPSYRHRQLCPPVVKQVTRQLAERRRLRLELRRARRALGARSQRQAAADLERSLTRFLARRAIANIACYYPNDGEIDPRPACLALRGRGTRVHLPMLYRGGENRLYFAAFDPATPMRENRLGIPEPQIAVRQWRIAREMDIILMPLVGFDAFGNRLGMGGGFYDRTLSFLTDGRRWRRPRLVGVAHECQRIDHLLVQPWDVPMDAVITDRAIYSNSTR